jgi:RimJ/RimL family protein N-acetyltransferase
MKNQFHNQGDIIISTQSYKYLLFNTLELINIMKNNPELTKSIEHCVSKLRKHDKFNILDLISESIRASPLECYYFIIYNESNNLVISTSRIFFDRENSTSFICMVYTSEEERNKGVCKIMLIKLIDLITDLFKCKRFGLEVNPFNTPAIKCYERVGFVFVRENVFYSKNEKVVYNLMELHKNT